MNKDEKVKVYNKLTELFISLGRNFDKITSKVWMDSVCKDHIDVVVILNGIQSYRDKNDGFPTVSKLLERLEKTNEFAKLITDIDKTLLRMDEKYQLEDNSMFNEPKKDEREKEWKGDK